MKQSFSNIAADQPVPPEMVDQLIATAYRNSSPDSKEYFALIDLDCERTYCYSLTDCESHSDAYAAARAMHRCAGRSETPLMMCRVGGPCREKGCECGGNMFMLRTYGVIKVDKAPLQQQANDDPFTTNSIPA